MRALADRVRTSPAVAQAALRAVADGTFAAWLESLPVGRGDPTWRSALADPWFLAQGTACGFWYGVYRNVHDRALALGRQGTSEALSAWQPLTQTGFAARYWDALKPLRASGELVAFILHAEGPPVAAQSLPRLNRAELDGSLNALLWALGMPGLVVEWGTNDHPVQSPEDLAALYDENPLAFEAELAKGYPIAWLTRRYRPEGREAVVLRFVSDVMLGRSPLGHAGAAIAALVRGGGRLPIEPRRPADAFATDVGPVGHPWSVVQSQLVSGLALCWLAAQGHSSVGPLAERALCEWHASQIPPPLPALLAEFTARGAGALYVQGLPAASVQPQSWPVPPAPTPPRPPPAPAARSGGGAIVALLGAVALGVGLWAVSYRTARTEPAVRDGAVRFPSTPTPTQQGDTPQPAATTPVAAPVVPPPSARCVPDGILRDVGTRAGPENGVELIADGEEVLAGWVVRPRYENGAENLALARLSRDGSVIAVPRSEDVDPTRGNPVPGRRIGRVALVRTADGAVDARADVNERTVAQQTISCSGVSNTRSLSGLDGPTPEDWASLGAAPPPPTLPTLPWMLYCRTVGESNPFIIGLNVTAGADVPIARDGELFAVRGTDLGARVTLGSLSFSDRALRAPDPVSYIQEHTSGRHSIRTESEQPKGLTAIDLPGRGYAVAFEHAEQIYFAWLASDLRLVGALSMVHFPGLVRRPRLAVDGDRVALLASADGHSDVFRLWGTSARFGETPPAPRAAMQTWAAPADHAFDPSAIAIGDGRWLVAFSQGVDHLHRNGPPRNVALQVFDSEFQPEGGPRLLDDPEAGYARLIGLPGGRFMVAWLSGRNDSQRVVRVLTGSCAGSP
ncbi:MAG: hypothetical protein U0326_07265 [Polyangiales bacterium]